jgi:putative addiction module component (TIGR02574 family)
MDIQAEKLSLIQWLAELTDEGIIGKIKNIQREKGSQISDELKATLDDRLRRYRENPNEGQSWEEVRKQISSK